METEYLEKGGSFEHVHREILQKYGKELPPPSPELLESLVVISHEELGNNNFWRLISSIANQINTDVNRFEVLIVLLNFSCLIFQM
ncbi:MAG TPA: hypothetical protein VJG67_03255 [Candidatus Paceibacterota bacterium]|nr:MAG: hypothetical protein A3J17_00680 [Candidatus Curtissbacteria bacterium RIFCSPLOWO2_02_FULL_40_11]